MDYPPEALAGATEDFQEMVDMGKVVKGKQVFRGEKGEGEEEEKREEGGVVAETKDHAHEDIKL